MDSYLYFIYRNNAKMHAEVLTKTATTSMFVRSLQKRNVQVFPHPTVAEIFNSMCLMCQRLKLTLPFSSTTTTTTDTSSRPLAPPVIGHICLLHCLCHPQQSQLAETAFPPAWESQTSYMAGGGGERPQSTEKKNIQVSFQCWCVHSEEL